MNRDLMEARTPRITAWGQIGMFLLLTVALGVIGLYLLDLRASISSRAQAAQPERTGALSVPPGQDVLSVEWRQQQPAPSAGAHIGVTTPDDVLSVEWLEQYRQNHQNRSSQGHRFTSPVPDNDIGFIE